MRRGFPSFAVLLALPCLAASPQTPTLSPLAQVTHEPIDEMSGIVKSMRFPNTYWVHNDSGDSPRFFAIRRDGTVINPPWRNRREDAGVEQKQPPFGGIAVGVASNIDWEDVAYDGDNLYLADVGNNGNARRDLGVYVVPEPNPEATEATRTARWIPIAYPDQQAFPPTAASEWSFDCEAVFWLRGKLYFVTKHRVEGGRPGVGANLYRLDSWRTDRVNLLRKIDGKADLGGWVTAADVSPDGRTLAVLIQAMKQGLWLFDIGRARGDRFMSAPSRFIPFSGAKQCEAVCFDDNETVIITNEQRDMFSLKVR